MIPRAQSNAILEAAQEFPVISIIGPRQSGKTTLAKALFADYTYLSLENIELRNFAQNDPKGFLETHSGKVILDEVQRVPDLFSYLLRLMTRSNE